MKSFSASNSHVTISVVPVTSRHNATHSTAAMRRIPSSLGMYTFNILSIISDIAMPNPRPVAGAHPLMIRVDCGDRLSCRLLIKKANPTSSISSLSILKKTYYFIPCHVNWNLRCDKPPARKLPFIPMTSVLPPSSFDPGISAWFRLFFGS